LNRDWRDRLTEFQELAGALEYAERSRQFSDMAFFDFVVFWKSWVSKVAKPNNPKMGL